MENRDVAENNETTDIVFILDRSGSMAGLEKDTIGGFNSMIKKKKDELQGKAIVSTVIFDTEIETIHDRIGIDSVPELTEKEYYARGGTALLDAVGLTIAQTVGRQKESGIGKTKTLFVITTDGYENSSKEYSYEKVKELIESKTKEGWEFIFLGANIDAAKEAERFGISRSHAADFCCDKKGIKNNFESIGEIMECYCYCDTIHYESLDNIRNDHKLRHRKH